MYFWTFSIICVKMSGRCSDCSGINIHIYKSDDYKPLATAAIPHVHRSFQNEKIFIRA